ncbi:MAG: rhodanese-like domain-containing protein [Emticicia sp.]|nr:rhodanese-like domain-containing protein [Emticicia sp.]
MALFDVSSCKLETATPFFVIINYIYSTKQLITETSNAVILDVRTLAEHKQGGIDGAINIDIMESSFTQKVATLDKDKTYFVFCRSGNRSGSACEMMSKNGFKNLYNLSGGMMHWPF